MFDGNWNLGTGHMFNQDIGRWNTAKVTNMHDMFNQGKFNQDVGMWNVPKVTYMPGMFYMSSFNQPLCWNLAPSAIQD
jgi:surface protein